MLAVGRGDHVMTWFDTGAFGFQIIVGIVVAAGPVSVTVEWGSGARNRIRRDVPRGVEGISEALAIEYRCRHCWDLGRLPDDQ